MKKQDYTKTLFDKELFDIVETLNYSNIVCQFNPDDLDKLEVILRLDYCSHMHEMRYVKKNNLFYIENCDLQYVDDLAWFIDNDYLIVDIIFTEIGFKLIKKSNKEVDDERE